MVKIELLSAVRYVYKGKLYTKFNSKGEKNIYMVNERLGRELCGHVNERDIPYFVPSMEDATVEEDEITEEVTQEVKPGEKAVEV